MDWIRSIIKTIVIGFIVLIIIVLFASKKDESGSTSSNTIKSLDKELTLVP